MAQYGSSDQTIQITTGNVRTTLDKFDSTKLNNAAVNTLGSVYYDNATSAAFPSGVPTKYRYVRYNSTANAAVLAQPGPVYWTDNTFTTVTSTPSESITAGLNMPAGIMMPNSTDISTLTATILNGNFVWIAVAGFVKGGASAGSIAADDLLIGNATAWTFTRVATGAAAPVQRPFAVALTAISSSKSDLWVICESL